MMRRRYIFAGIFFAVMVTLSLAWAAEIDAGGGSFFIDNRAYYESRKRDRVNFPHEKHMCMDHACTRCHHDYQRGRNVIDLNSLTENNRSIRCINCHGRYGRAREKLRLPEAYHAQCVTCHRDVIKSGRGRPPLLCGECHLPVKKNTRSTTRKKK